MEAGFGQPLPGRRLHTDDRAHDATEALGARAFALGNDVFFARGEYQPESAAGTHLLAHELAHTLQPESGPQARLTVGRADDPAEHEAESAARTVTRRLAVRAAEGTTDRAPAPPTLQAMGGLGAIRCMGRATEPEGFDVGDVRFVPPSFLGPRSIRTFETIQRRIESGRLLGPAIVGAAVILAATSSPEEYAVQLGVQLGTDQVPYESEIEAIRSIEVIVRERIRQDIELLLINPQGHRPGEALTREEMQYWQDVYRRFGF